MDKQSGAARPPIAQTAPDLVELTDRVLFGDVWERPGVSPRERPQSHRRGEPRKEGR